MQHRENTAGNTDESFSLRTAMTSPGMMHGHIVVAEDDEATADLLRACLTQAGYEVTVVTDGQAALEAVTTDRPDLILLDERMASRAGHEVARRLKASEETRFIPLVILTSGSGSEDKERLLEVGADDLITKPFHSTELLIRVRSLLRLGRLHQDLMDNNRELQAAYETARESEAKYRALIQDAQDALLLVDPSSATILEANRRARELSGYDEDDLIGQTASMLCSEGAAGNCQALIARVMTEGRAIAEGDGTLRCKGGEDIPIEIHASLANHHLGKPLIQALIRDLRPRRQLESERNKSERLAAVVETAVTVNHEINNPLFVIISSVESLQRTLFNADSGVRDKLERISEACRRIQRFTQQLSSVIAPVSKEYLPGLKMLDIQQSVAAKPDADAGDTHEPGP